MPVTKTAKRALKVSKIKLANNNIWRGKLEIALRTSRKSKSEKNIKTAISLADRLAKKNIIHKNKASRIKSTLSTLLPKKTAKKATKAGSPKKNSK